MTLSPTKLPQSVGEGESYPFFSVMGLLWPFSHERSNIFFFFFYIFFNLLSQTTKSNRRFLLSIRQETRLALQVFSWGGPYLQVRWILASSVPLSHDLFQESRAYFSDSGYGPIMALWVVFALTDGSSLIAIFYF